MAQYTQENGDQHGDDHKVAERILARRSCPISIPGWANELNADNLAGPEQGEQRGCVHQPPQAKLRHYPIWLAEKDHSDHGKKGCGCEGAGHAHGQPHAGQRDPGHGQTHPAC
jgi:hypothetical protein